MPHVDNLGYAEPCPAASGGLVSLSGFGMLLFPGSSRMGSSQATLWNSSSVSMGQSPWAASSLWWGWGSGCSGAGIAQGRELQAALEEVGSSPPQARPVLGLKYWPCTRWTPFPHPCWSPHGWARHLHPRLDGQGGCTAAQGPHCDLQHPTLVPSLGKNGRGWDIKKHYFPKVDPISLTIHKSQKITYDHLGADIIFQWLFQLWLLLTFESILSSLHPLILTRYLLPTHRRDDGVRGQLCLCAIGAGDNITVGECQCSLHGVMKPSCSFCSCDWLNLAFVGP